jgi:hypothetical protein
MRELFAAATFSYSPIGMIPKDYPRLAELCKAANIRYTDTQQEDISYRDWAVVPDETDSKSSTTKFTRFCVLQAYIEHMHPDWTRASVLDAAIENKTDLPQHWMDAHNHCARKGVYGYDVISHRDKNGKPVDINF